MFSQELAELVKRHAELTERQRQLKPEKARVEKSVLGDSPKMSKVVEEPEH